MRPELIRIGDFALPTYGTMLVISFLVGLFLVKRAARKQGIKPAVIENLAFWIMLGVIIGGRLFYVAFHWRDYQDIISIIAIWRGGMMFFGSFIGALAAGSLYMRREKIPLLPVMDFVAPSIALGEFFTRIGCFMNGCCFGKPTDLPWGVKFPPHSVAGSSAVGSFHLHPTQPLSSLFGLLLFFFLQRRLGQRHAPGEIFAYYLIASGAFRFGIDFIRYYEDTPNFLVNQIVSLAVVAAGIALLVLVTRRRKPA